jgi:hypothetical protein
MIRRNDPRALGACLSAEQQARYSAACLLDGDPKFVAGAAATEVTASVGSGPSPVMMHDVIACRRPVGVLILLGLHRVCLPANPDDRRERARFWDFIDRFEIRIDLPDRTVAARRPSPWC